MQYRTLVTFAVAGLILAVCLSCFGFDQHGSKSVSADRKTNTQLAIQVTASHSLVKLPPKRVELAPYNCEPNENKVRLYAKTTSSHKAKMNFIWQVPVGRLIGKDREVTWDLSNVNEGTYTATVEASDEHKHTANGSITVTVVICPGAYRESPCPVIMVSCPTTVESNGLITFEATVSGGDPEIKPTYKWSVTAGKIISGKATQKITVDVSGLTLDSITGTVSVGGAHKLCATTASCTVLSGIPKSQRP